MITHRGLPTTLWHRLTNQEKQGSNEQVIHFTTIVILVLSMSAETSGLKESKNGSDSADGATHMLLATNLAARLEWSIETLPVK